MARRLQPFECEITSLGARGVGLGYTPDGAPIQIRGAPPGGRVAVVPSGRAKGRWNGRRTALVRPPAAWTEPQCAQFGLCGGCTLQELDLAAQRAAKAAFGLREIEAEHGPLEGVVVHSIRGTSAAYGYRNKVELSFGGERFQSEEAHLGGASKSGRFLGFHAPGRFDRVVDAPRCELVSEALNRVIAVVREHTLAPGSPPPWNPHTHTGFWRHLMLREADGRCLVVLFTTSAPGHEDRIAELARALAPYSAGFQWRINDSVADVARGDVRHGWGLDHVEEVLGPVRFRLGPMSFFQTNTAATVVLYDTVGEALRLDAVAPGGRLVDLYCGIGSIGLYLASRFDSILGVEENPESVADARLNAERNGIPAEFVAARVEDVLDAWTDRDVHVVVDPPRAGLHPRVAERLARMPWASLVYVACHPQSLGRDAAILRGGGARLTDLWTVDLFPHTGHVEMVGRFVR